MKSKKMEKIKLSPPKGKVFLGGKSITISNEAVPSKPPKRKFSREEMARLLKTISEQQLFIEPTGIENAQ